MKTLSGCPPTDGSSKLQANPDTDLTALAYPSRETLLDASTRAGVTYDTRVFRRLVCLGHASRCCGG
jgi:hypothetical protein